jgi:hypothetical protein
MIYTRFADMVSVCLPSRRSWSRWLLLPVALCACATVWLPSSARAQATAKPAAPAPPAQTKDAVAKEAITKDAATKDANFAPDVTGPVADPSQSSKVDAAQTFKDKNAEALLDNTFPEIRARQAVTAADIEAFKIMASNPNAPVDRAIIERVVDAMVAKLTSHTNLKAVLPPDPEAPAAAGATAANKEIQDATTTLLEPIFTARSQGNAGFLNIYNRVLIQKLTPVLKNHLIARVQAMIVLGQSGHADSIDLYINQIRDPKQTLWVKLWALEGISNIKANGGRLSADKDIAAARAITIDFLDDSKLEIPWPVKLRALAALGSLRQGFIVSAPRKAEMANTAMRILADPEERFEVRAEAARALGLMQITSQVPKYNYPLIAFAVGQLTVDLASRINTCFSGDPKKARQLDQPDKARYFAALLVSPIYQAFDGVPGFRDSGLVHASVGDSGPFLQQSFELVTAVIKAVLPMLNAGPRQIPDQKKELVARINALKAFLGQNPPADTHLVQNGPEFKLAVETDPPVAARAPKVAGAPK